MNASPDHDEIEKSKAPLLEHLAELRTRLIWSVVALAGGFAVAFTLSGTIFDILMRPLVQAFGDEEGRRMIMTGAPEGFFVSLRIGFFGGLCLAFPVIANQIWLFVAPGLYKQEKRAALPYLVATPILFILGGALVYFFVMPLALAFFLSFEQPGGAGSLPIQLEARVSEYLDLVMVLIFGFGVSFQLPVLLTLLGHVGIIDSAYLKKHRRYAIVIVFAVAAVLTPPDVISQFGMGIPMLLLYEGSIWCVMLMERARRKAAVSEPDAEPATQPPPP